MIRTNAIVKYFTNLRLRCGINHVNNLQNALKVLEIFKISPGVRPQTLQSIALKLSISCSQALAVALLLSSSSCSSLALAL